MELEKKLQAILDKTLKYPLLGTETIQLKQRFIQAVETSEEFARKEEVKPTFEPVTNKLIDILRSKITDSFEDDLTVPVRRSDVIEALDNLCSQLIKNAPVSKSVGFNSPKPKPRKALNKAHISCKETIFYALFKSDTAVTDRMTYFDEYKSHQDFMQWLFEQREEVEKSMGPVNVHNFKIKHS